MKRSSNVLFRKFAFRYLSTLDDAKVVAEKFRGFRDGHTKALEHTSERKLLLQQLGASQ
jgi:hypothetical protein